MLLPKNQILKLQTILKNNKNSVFYITNNNGISKNNWIYVINNYSFY